MSHAAISSDVMCCLTTKRGCVGTLISLYCLFRKGICYCILANLVPRVLSNSFPGARDTEPGNKIVVELVWSMTVEMKISSWGSFRMADAVKNRNCYCMHRADHLNKTLARYLKIKLGFKILAWRPLETYLSSLDLRYLLINSSSLWKDVPSAKQKNGPDRDVCESPSLIVFRYTFP